MTSAEQPPLQASSESCSVSAIIDSPDSGVPPDTRRRYECGRLNQEPVVSPGVVPEPRRQRVRGPAAIFLLIYGLILAERCEYVWGEYEN